MLNNRRLKLNATVRKVSLSVWVVVVALVLGSCGGGGAQGSSDLEATAFAEKINELPAAPVIDVRTPEEFANGHLKNARNVDWNGSDFEGSVAALDKESPVFVYCLSGGRSSAAANKMRQLGFKTVYELNGGIMKWRAANLPEENANAAGMTPAEFDALLATDKKVLIDFYADWCGPCKKMAPYLEELKTAMADSILIVRINADQNQAIAKTLQVDALPTLFFYSNKQALWIHRGFIDKQELLAKMQVK